jgi:hypothetical protein
MLKIKAIRPKTKISLCAVLWSKSKSKKSSITLWSCHGASKLNIKNQNGLKSLYFSGLINAVVNMADCYPKGSGFDIRVMHEFFPHVEEVEDFGLQSCNHAKEEIHV